jgi:thymidylate synthase
VRITVPTIDDALLRSYEFILASGTDIASSSRGANREVLGVQIEISNPLARISRSEARSTSTIYSAFGEFLWYLAQTDDFEFIKYYAPRYSDYVKVENGRVPAAYGPRLFAWDGIDQVSQVIQVLQRRPWSKQAVIQLFDRKDLAAGLPDIPCTCSVQFLCRDGRLDAITMMRSNDAVRGLPHDIFAFTMLQELIARTLSVELGIYRHWVSSLHIYESSAYIARDLIREGWQQTVGSAMELMPTGDPWPFVRQLLAAEQAFRVDRRKEPWTTTGSPYWDSLVWLLEMLRHFKDHDAESARASWERRPTKAFDIFVETRLRKVTEQRS